MAFRMVYDKKYSGALGRGEIFADLLAPVDFVYYFYAPSGFLVTASPLIPGILPIAYYY